jgi:dihydrofolate reductase
VQAVAAAEGMATTDTYLFGLKTYEHMASFWPTGPSDDPFATHLNNTPRYVASTMLESTGWQNSTLLNGDVGEAVAGLKQHPGCNIAVLGSDGLVETLIEYGLGDELFLTIDPLILGSGKRLVRGAGERMNLSLVDSKATTTGAVMLTYRPQ